MAASSSMLLANVHLRADQKRLLQERADKNGTKFAEEMRAAVDAYLSGVSRDELDMLETASLQTERLFKDMTKTLEVTNANAEKIFKMMEALKAQAGA